MSKILALFIFSSICFFGFYSNDSISKNISAAAAAPTATPTLNAPNDSFSIELDRATFINPCPPGYRCLQSDADSAPIIVTVFNAKREDSSLRYKYTASGGRVIGDGAKISWDLTGGQPGTYQITVVIADESGNELQTITKTITVLSYQDDGDRCLSCPELSVDAPTTPTQAGETMVFTANVRYGNAENMIYKWTVTGGKIIEGQGTPTVKVAANPKMAGKVVKVIAKLIWDCSEICKDNTASASGSVAAKKRKGK